MYNYQKFLKQSKHATQLRRLQRIQKQEQSHRQQLAKALIANHDKRIQHSILTLIQHPQKVNCYRDPIYKPREQDKSKRVVDGEMMYNYQKQPIRISKNLSRNSSLDLVPFKNASLYQFRQDMKEKGGRGSLIQFSNEKQAERKDNICSQIREIQNNRVSRISLKDRPSKLPNLQKLPKTYFHTLETIINKPDTLRITIDQKGNQSLSLSHKHGPYVAIAERKIETENREERERIKEEKLRKCKKALEKCGVIPQEMPSESRIERHSIVR